MMTSNDSASSSLSGRSVGNVPRRFKRAIALVAAIGGAFLAADLLFPLSTLDPATLASQQHRNLALSLSTSDPRVKELFCDEGGGEPMTTLFVDGYPEPEKPLDGCFISSIFGMSPSESDRPLIIGPQGHILRSEYRRYEFLMFTNMIDLEAPGWRKVLHFDKSKRRMITQSRWPKFMAWRLEWVRKHCPVVFYIDGNVAPKRRKSALFKDQKAAILKSEVGFTQKFNGKDIETEFSQILRYKKDTKANEEATRAWMERQPDYAKGTKSRVFSNNYISYDPNSPTFQRLTSYFWDVYSREELMWRDQPLWAYALHHLGLEPLVPIPKKMYRTNMKGNMGSGKGKHIYDDSADDEAKRYLAMVRETGVCGGYPGDGTMANSTLGALM